MNTSFQEGSLIQCVTQTEREKGGKKDDAMTIIITSMRELIFLRYVTTKM